MKYTFDTRIRYSECNHRGTLTLPGIINYLQDCSTFQSEDIGFGVKKIKEQKRAWILSYWQIVVERYPKMMEKVTVGTFASKFKGIIGERNFFLNDAEGRRIVSAASVWVHMDTERMRPVRPSEKEINAYGEEEPLDMEYEGRKIVLPEHIKELESFPIRRYHIDTNEHVNNCQYVQMALEMIPADKIIRQVRVEYRKSAVYGDVIYPKLAEAVDRTVVELCDAQGNIFAVVEFKE